MTEEVGTQNTPKENLGKVVTVRAFGARLMGGADAEQQATSIFIKQNRLWNKLVEIEHAARVVYREALVASDAELGDLNKQADELQLVIDSLIEARNRERANKRSKKTENAVSYAALIKTNAEALKAIRAKMKDCKARAKEAAKPILDQAELERRAKVKVALAESDLWWGHSETVIASFDVARVKAMKEGRELRFHRFDGEGSMGVRFTVDGGSMAKIYAGSTALLRFRDPTPEELGRRVAVKGDGSKLQIIEIRAGDKREDKTVPTLTFMVTIHAGREFPNDAPLKTVTVTRTMHVQKPEWKMVLTFSRAATGSEPLPELPVKAVGIDFGFRSVRTDDGSNGLRVATISYGDKVEFVTLDSDWLHRIDRAERMRSELDHMSTVFWEQIKPLINEDALAALPDDAWFKVLAGKVRRSKAAYTSLLIKLCEAHDAQESPLGEDVNTTMRTFRREALKKWEQAHHIKRRALDHRKHLYRNVAARIVNAAGLIGIKDTNFRQLATLEDGAGNETELVKPARSNRTMAAPSELRMAIEQAAKREKRELIKVPSAHTTRTCSACGHVHPVAIEDLTFVCESCGKVWDQDENSSHVCRNFAMNEAESLGASMT